jgi:DNA repair protein RadD
VAHAKHVAKCFVEAGVPAEHMDAKTKMHERGEIFARYRAGVTRIVVGVGVFVAGVDEDVRCIIAARPTKSPILWVQSIGRGLRRAPGKDHLLILDHTGNSLRLGTVDAIMFDKLHDGKKGVDLWSDEEREAAAEARASLPKLCVECAAVVPRGETKCHQCGHEFNPVSMIKVVDGDLVRLDSNDPGRIGSTFEEQQTFYREVLGHVRQRGLKSGFAFHKFVGRYGTKPPWEWQRLSPLTPTQATLNEIKRQSIAWARSQARS